MGAWEIIVSDQRKYVSAFEVVPFQTERVNSALEGLIVIDYIPPPIRRCRRRQSPKARCGTNPLWEVNWTLEGCTRSRATSAL